MTEFMTGAAPFIEPLIRKVIIVHSPRSGRSKQLTQALTSLQSAGITVADMLPISSLASLPLQGNRWQAEGIDCVIAAGGDGLLGSVVAHVVPVGLPLGILPLGTGNDVARSVGIPMDIEQAVAVIRQGRRQKIDLGIAYSAMQEAALSDARKVTGKKGMYFVHALTVGLNVQFARTATRTPVRQRYGFLTYPYAVYHALRTYKRIEVSIEFEGLVLRSSASAPPVITQESATLHSHIAQVSVVNTAVFWGAFEARLPGVSLHDSVLDIVVIEDGFWQDLRYHISRWFQGEQPDTSEERIWHTRYPELLPAQLTEIPGIHHVQARGVKISACGQRREATLDGEVRGFTPIHAQVAPQQLCLLAPSPFE